MKKITSFLKLNLQIILTSSIIAALVSGIFTYCGVVYNNKELDKREHQKNQYAINQLRYENLQDILEKLITVESPNFEILQEGTEAEVFSEFYNYEKNIEVLYDKAKLLMSKESIDKLSYYEFGRIGKRGLEVSEGIYEVHFPTDNIIEFYYQCRHFEFDFRDCIQEDIRKFFELD